MHYADYKTILSPQNGINLYRGCSHGCIYCDSRSTCYEMRHEFEDIEVKRNAAPILESQLKKRRARCMISTGSMSDPYLPLEQELGLTRECLSLIEKHGFGATVLTKSARVLRDLDLLAAIGENAKCVAQLTLTTFDDALCKQLEPNASPTSERAAALAALRDAGVPTVVWLGPILPFLNDTEQNLRGLLDYCFDAGVKGIVCFGFGVTLRAGSREYFYAALDRLFPGLKRRYIEQFGDAYICNSPNHAALMDIFETECKQRGVLYRPDDVFGYLRHFEPKPRQLSLFGLDGVE